jgi:hypothetical protein
MTKKKYVKPAVVMQREIEALAGTCVPGDGPGPTGMDKISFDPTTGICMNPMT